MATRSLGDALSQRIE